MHGPETPQVNTSSTAAPPPRLHLAVMIWAAVFPTLTLLQLVLGEPLRNTPVIVRTFVFSSIAVPIVVYVLLPRLQRVRSWLVGQR